LKTTFAVAWAQTMRSHQTRPPAPRYTQTLDRPSGASRLDSILNLAVQQKRLAVNPCGPVEFPVSFSKSTRKPRYMTSTEQMRIELVAPCYLKHLVVLLTEIGLRPY
jgi:hypothetical protein